MNWQQSLNKNLKITQKESEINKPSKIKKQ